MQGFSGRATILRFVPVLALCGGGDDATMKEDFESSAVAALPKGFTAAIAVAEKDASGTLVKWAVAEDASAPSGKHVLKLAETKNRGEVFNLLMRDAAAPVDLALEVKLHADSGSEDRGGGVLWRAKDEHNFYLCRWNPLEKNLRAYRVEKGRRVQLQSVPIETDAGAWHTLRVVMKGRVMEISFDGKRQITCADSTYAEAGKVGLWTRSDAQSSFDDWTIDAAK